MQLYSLGTPNGQKVTIMLEELLALGHRARVRRLADQDRFGRSVRQRLRRGQPELQDPGAGRSQAAQADPRLRERRDPGHLAEKFGNAFLPTSGEARAECLSVAVLADGQRAYLGGGFGHFYAYAPSKIEYAIDRFAMEAKRSSTCSTAVWREPLPRRNDYTVADMGVAWYGALAKADLRAASSWRCTRQERQPLGRQDRPAPP